MRFLDEPKLEQLNTYLSSTDVGDRILNGRVEAYSFKLFRQDKRVLRELHKQYTTDASAENSPEVGIESPSLTVQTTLTKSPIGPMRLPSTRKLLTKLIVTLNSSFPDYDFSDAGPDDFIRVPGYLDAVRTINNQIVNPMNKVQRGFKAAFWEAVDDTINLHACEVYHYVPDLDTDVFSVGKLFSLNFFFINRRLRRLCFVTCAAVSKLHSEPEPTLESFMDMEELRNEDADELHCEAYEAKVRCGSSSSWMGNVDLIAIGKQS